MPTLPPEAVAGAPPELAGLPFPPVGPPRGADWVCCDEQAAVANAPIKPTPRTDPAIQEYRRSLMLVVLYKREFTKRSFPTKLSG